MMRFELIAATEDDILRVLDDDLFWGDLDPEYLEEQAELIAEQDTEGLDCIVYAALQRVLNITIPNGDTMYAMRSKR